jgi:vacuolar-type H+-ATPase subunit E/Vma4
MLLNLGLAPIPPVPLMPQTQDRIRRSYDTAAMQEARRRLMAKKAAMRNARQAEAIAYMRKAKKAQTKNIKVALNWSGSKVIVVMNELLVQGLVNVYKDGPMTFWEFVDAGH